MRRRFVIQNHSTASGSHYDLMLESGGALATWRIGRLPAELAPGETMGAQALPDHRLAYLTCEGEISGGRGSVAIADAGEYRQLSRGPDAWTFELSGERVHGTFELTRIDADQWELRRCQGHTRQVIGDR